MAEAVNFKIKKGLEKNLYLETFVPEEGCWYLTTDTTKVFVYVDGELKQIKAEANFDSSDVTIINGGNA